MVSFDSSSSVKRQLMSNGLFSLASGLTGTKVYLELRTGTFAIGILDDCDKFFNMRIRKALVLRARKEERVDEFFVAGRHIRYMHFDHFVDVSKSLNKSRFKSRKRHGPKHARNALSGGASGSRSSNSTVEQ